MPESVWDNIYKGIKNFAGDENTANVLIGGGIGAGIGGLIDGWRGAGIGALGGGIAGYKSNDIIKWWNTPTKELKNTPTPYTAPPKYLKSDKELMNALPLYDYNPVNTYDKIAYALIKNNQNIDYLEGLSTADINKWFAENGIGQDNNWIFDTFASNVAKGKYGTRPELVKSINRIQSALTTAREQNINPKFKYHEQYQNDITEYNKQHPYEQIDHEADQSENLKKLQAWKNESKQQQENLKQKN